MQYQYKNKGIYVGNDKVIHFTRRGQEVGTGTVLDGLLLSSGPTRCYVPCESCIPPLEGHGVVSSCLNCFLGGGVLYLFEYAVNPAPFLAKVRGGTCTFAVGDEGEAVVHRANYLLNNGFGCYNLFKNNCEDFAIYCKTGLLVLDHSTMGQSGQVASIIGGPVAAVLSTALAAVSIIGGPLAADLCTALALAAATAVGVYCVSRCAADTGMRKDVVKVSAEDLTRFLQVLEPCPAACLLQLAASIVNYSAHLWNNLLKRLARFGTLLRKVFGNLRCVML